MLVLLVLLLPLIFLLGVFFAGIVQFSDITRGWGSSSEWGEVLLPGLVAIFTSVTFVGVISINAATNVRRLSPNCSRRKRVLTRYCRGWFLVLLVGNCRGGWSIFELSFFRAATCDVLSPN